MPGPRTPRTHVKFESKTRTQPARRGGEAGPRIPVTPAIPDIQITPEANGRSRSRMFFIVGLAAIVGLIVAAAVLGVERPDPHFVKARQMVTNYEQGKSFERRNYGNQIYQAALDQLVQVDPESVSADPAKQLSDEIRNGMRDFEDRQQQAKAERGLNLEEHQRARQRIQANNARERANPQTDFPECDEEETETEPGSGS